MVKCMLYHYCHYRYNSSKTRTLCKRQPKRLACLTTVLSHMYLMDRGCSITSIHMEDQYLYMMAIVHLLYISTVHQYLYWCTIYCTSVSIHDGYMHACMWLYCMYMYRHVCMYCICMYLCTYVCMYVCMHQNIRSVQKPISTNWPYVVCRL